MWDTLPSIWTLAQDDIAPVAPSNGGDAASTAPGTPGSPAAPGGGPGPGSPFGGDFLFIILAVFVAMILMQILTSRKDRKRRERMLSAIKKGDRVKTIGGEHGAVMELREQMVLLKVDENNNTKIWYDRSAVQAVVQEKIEKPEKAESPESGQKLEKIAS